VRYGDHVVAFLESVRVGANVLALDQTHDKFLDNPALATARDDLFSQWAEATRDYEASRARLRLIASRRLRRLADDLDQYIEVNITNVPPFRRGTPVAEWGSEATTGPQHVEKVGAALVGTFVDKAAKDVQPKLGFSDAAMPTCSGSRIVHRDGSVQACTNDEDETCAGREEHDGSPIRCRGVVARIVQLLRRARWLR
jgi:hypothetical protein